MTDWKQRIADRHGDKYSYCETPLRAHQKIKITCEIHGIFNQLVCEHANGAGCPKCSVVRRTKMRWGDAIRTRDKITLSCEIHGTYQKVESQRRRGLGGCPKCSFKKRGLKRRVTYSEFIQRVNLVQPVGTQWETKTDMLVHDKIRVVCPLGHVWNPLIHDHLRGMGCPICAKRQSRGEREIGEYLRSIGLHVEERNRSLLGKEIDLYLPEQKIGIEYNGLFWHCENPRFYTGKTKDYHINKTNLAEKRAIRLIHINEDEWRDRQTAVKTALQLMTGKTIKIHARKLKIREISLMESNTFLNTHHIGGSASGTIRYGAYQDDILVGVAVYGKPTRQTISYPWELKRYCVRVAVPGLLSRFMKKFGTAEAGDVVTYLDRRWFSGTVYTKNGFVLDGNVAVDYSYVDLDSKKRYHKSRFRRKDGISERERTKDMGKIWDCGKLRYVWKNQ